MRSKIADYDATLVGAAKEDEQGVEDRLWLFFSDMEKGIAMEMGFEFRFIRLNEAISLSYVREHLLRN